MNAPNQSERIPVYQFLSYPGQTALSNIVILYHNRFYNLYLTSFDSIDFFFYGQNLFPRRMLRIGGKWQLPKMMPCVWALIAHSLGIRCPRLVHSLPKACSHDAQGLFTWCPRLVHILTHGVLQQTKQPDMLEGCGMEDRALYVREANGLGKMHEVDICIAIAKGYLWICLTYSCCFGCVIVKK